MSDLENSLEFFHKMFQNHEAVVLLINSRDKRITAWNQSAEKFYGYSSEEFKSLKISDINILPEDDLLAEITKAALREQHYFEFQHRKKNGSLVDVSVQISPVLIDDKQYLLSIINDISVRLEFERELLQQKQWSETIFHSANSGIMIIDRDTHTIVDINEAALNSIGGQKEDVVGHLCHKFVCPDEVNCCPINEFCHSISNDEKILYTLTGEEIPIIKSVVETQIGKKDFLIETFIDIKKRKQVEKNLIESEKQLKALDASKDKFFSMIAHDLRSPFSGLLGISDLMAKEINTLSNQDLQEMAKALNQASNSTFNLLNELLDWSRMQTGDMPFNPSEHNLSETIETSAALYTNAAERKKLKIDVIIDANMVCLYDSTMISTVIRNLISNAIKFTKETGVIVISSTINTFENIISVEDSGIGIPETHIDKLFKIETHYTTPGTSNEKGTGLGLILCKEFVEKHGGRIWVESDVGYGSTFSFTIPRKN